MVTYHLYYTPQAKKDAKKLSSSHLKENAAFLLELIQRDPFAPYPAYEKLGGDMNRAYSRRINKQHRLVYEVIESEHAIKILRMWTHYE